MAPRQNAENENENGGDHMTKQHLKCEQLLKDTNAEYERIIDALNSLLRGETTAEDVNAITNNAINRVDGMIDSYLSNSNNSIS